MSIKQLLRLTELCIFLQYGNKMPEFIVSPEVNNVLTHTTVCV